VTNTETENSFTEFIEFFLSFLFSINTPMLNLLLGKYLDSPILSDTEVGAFSLARANDPLKNRRGP